MNKKKGIKAKANTRRDCKNKTCRFFLQTASKPVAPSFFSYFFLLPTRNDTPRASRQNSIIAVKSIIHITAHRQRHNVSDIPVVLPAKSSFCFPTDKRFYPGGRTSSYATALFHLYAYPLISPPAVTVFQTDHTAVNKAEAGKGSLHRPGVGMSVDTDGGG